MRNWNKKEIEILEKKYSYGNIEELAKRLNRTTQAIMAKAKRLKFRRKKKKL